MATAARLEVTISADSSKAERTIRRASDRVHRLLWGPGVAYGLLGPATEAELPAEPIRWAAY